MTNSSMRTRKAMGVWGREGVATGGDGLRGDVGAGVACSLRNFYATLELNFHQFCAGGFCNTLFPLGQARLHLTAF
jgi:hypothetical protein